MKTVGTFLFNLSGWLLMVAMVLAVWMRGGVPPWAIYVGWGVLSASAVCWGVGLTLLRRVPTITPVTFVAAILLLQGWVMALNPASRYNPVDKIFTPLPDHITLLPASWDGYSSVLGMISFTILFVVFHVALDCWRNDTFRQQMMWALTVSTAVVAAVGILQKAGLVAGGLKAQDMSEFGPYGYHANAAALMLGSLPVAASLAVGAWVLNRKAIGTIASALTLLIIAGIFANTARSAVALSIFLMIGLALAYWTMIGGVLPGTWLARFVTIAGIILVAAGGIGISAIVMPAKWHALIDQITWLNPRLLQWKIILGMSWDAGFFGTGPNTFSLTFPVTEHFDSQLYNKYILTYHTPGEEMSIWSHAHSDPLQALVEFGWFGFVVWIVAGVWTAAAAIKQMYIPAPLQVKFSLLAAFAGWLAMMVYSMFDFPMQVLSLQVVAVPSPHSSGPNA
jgi:hypothetical protein